MLIDFSDLNVFQFKKVERAFESIPRAIQNNMCNLFQFK